MGVPCSHCCRPPPAGAGSAQDKALCDIKDFARFQLGPDGKFSVTNLNLHEDPTRATHIRSYYNICTKAIGLHVTTSCFSIWRKHKKSNAFAKVIPAVRMEPGETTAPCRVFFFDDNLEWDGLEGSSGICNLRDVTSGEFVEFTEGTNGFKSAKAAKHTVIYYSTVYNCVLVKANILDAVEDGDYFSRIVQTYARPEEKVIVYMDVNSTIVCNDAVQSKDLASSLLSTMFEFMELVPKQGAFDFTWETLPTVKVEKKQSLKKLVKAVTEGNTNAYRNFFSETNCRQFVAQILAFADMRWADGETPIKTEEFMDMFRGYLATISNGIDQDGIVSSWFKCSEMLKSDHAIVINSFGVDTRKVIKATIPDEQDVLQIVVNYELWEARDLEKFEAQFND